MRTSLAALPVSLLVLAAPAFAQPPMPQPGPEHEMLKKDVGTWIDTMMPGYYTTEATYDPASKTMTSTMEGPDPSGQVARTKATMEWKDPDTRVFSMYGPDGKLGMRITYRRRK